MKLRRSVTSHPIILSKPSYSMVCQLHIHICTNAKYTHTLILFTDTKSKVQCRLYVHVQAHLINGVVGRIVFRPGSTYA